MPRNLRKTGFARLVDMARAHDIYFRDEERVLLRAGLEHAWELEEGWLCYEGVRTCMHVLGAVQCKQRFCVHKHEVFVFRNLKNSRPHSQAQTHMGEQWKSCSILLFCQALVRGKKKKKLPK
mmetsp:Transcript_14352/g.16531  ORF Transcript_14352/g.16531 Transcript_14352/m.16531 type:complete len:122 (-) Transcript_14352:35-400(-)